MKFGQLIECNLRNIFIEKSCTKCGGETSPRRFSQKLKFSISGSIVQSFIQLFLLYGKLRAFKIY